MLGSEDSEENKRARKYVLQPMGVSANSRTVWLMTSSGSEVMSVERMNHCLPAVEKVRITTSERGTRIAALILQTFGHQNLGDAILLIQKLLLIHFVQQAGLSIPARDRL